MRKFVSFADSKGNRYQLQEKDTFTVVYNGKEYDCILDSFRTVKDRILLVCELDDTTGQKTQYRSFYADKIEQLTEGVV